MSAASCSRARRSRVAASSASGGMRAMVIVAPSCAPRRAWPIVTAAKGRSGWAALSASHLT
jgi:hypothetical protein